MINDLTSSSNEVWKFVDDTSLSEKIMDGDISRRVFPDSSYDDALRQANLSKLYDRRSDACKKLFLDALTNGEHKLHYLIPPESKCPYSLRTCNKLLVPRCRTDRFMNSLIIANSLKFNK